ncbi:segregation and condensation protein A [Paucilactobacillus sp. N302-9]
MANNEDFTLVSQPKIKVSDFEGPLDLLLHLIRSSEMDIYDIQISAITEQYLAYLHQMQDHQLEVAGDYLVMAATLMAIKSKLLLPTDDEPLELDDQQEEPVDPRQELVDQLLEYQRYKKAAVELKQKEHDRQQEFTRQAASIPAGVTGSKLAPGLTLEQLQQAFSKVLKRQQYNTVVNQTVQSEQVSIAEKIKQVFMTVKHGPVLFEELFTGQILLDDLVTTFLAVLELAKHQAIVVAQSTLFGDLTLDSGPQSEEYAHDQFGTD